MEVTFQRVYKHSLKEIKASGWQLRRGVIDLLPEPLIKRVEVMH